MIREMRRRFIRIAIAVLAVAMALVTVIINAANWMNVRAELLETMTYLSEGVSLPGGMSGGQRPSGNFGGSGGQRPSGMSGMPGGRG